MMRDRNDDGSDSSRAVPPTKIDSQVPPTGIDAPVVPTGIEAGLAATGIRPGGWADHDQESLQVIRLPAKLADTHKIVGELPSGIGGEAALRLVREKETGATQVYKAYFRPARRDEEVWARLDSADRAAIHGHVVDIKAFGTSGGMWLELME